MELGFGSHHCRTPPLPGLDQPLHYCCPILPASVTVSFCLPIPISSTLLSPLLLTSAGSGVLLCWSMQEVSGFPAGTLAVHGFTHCRSAIYTATDWFQGVSTSGKSLSPLLSPGRIGTKVARSKVFITVALELWQDLLVELNSNSDFVRVEF